MRRVHDYRSASLSLSNIADLIAEGHTLDARERDAVAAEIRAIITLLEDEVKIFETPPEN